MLVATGTYAGNDTARTISGVGFQPDMVMVKDVGNSYDTWFITKDMTAGLSLPIRSDGAGDTVHITGLAADGFTLGTNITVNGGSHSYVYLAIKANGMNDFATVTYTGDATDDRLVFTAFQPNYALLKSNTAITGAEKYAGQASALATQTSNISSTVYQGGADRGDLIGFFAEGMRISNGSTFSNLININAAVHYGFVLAENAATSKAFTYTGDGSASKTLFTSAFQPAFVHVKQTDGASPYMIYAPQPAGSGMAFDSTVGTNAFTINSTGATSGSNGNSNTSGKTYNGIAMASGTPGTRSGITASATGGAWSSTAAWVGGVVPTAADDVNFVSTSGNVTIDAGAVCRSIDCTGYAGTLTHTAGVTWTIGSSTAGSLGVALRFVVGMTYTLGNDSTSAINFISTATSVQTIGFSGKTTGSVTFSGAGSSYQYTSNHSQNGGYSKGSVNLSQGTLDLNGTTCTWSTFISTGSPRTLIGNGATINITGGNGSNNGWTTTSSNFTTSLATTTINFARGYSASSYTIDPGGAQLGIVTFNDASGNSAVNTLLNCISCTINNTAVKTYTFTVNVQVTCSGAFTANGNSAINRILVTSNTIGTQKTISAATAGGQNVDFQDINAIGAASWNLSAIIGGSGDSGGNSGITFTTSALQTWSGTTGAVWSANAWTSRVPLPQDDVLIASAFSASQSIVADMPRLGRSISFAGVTGNPSWVFNNIGTYIFGSITLDPNMTVAGTLQVTLAGRGSYTITSAGKTFGMQINHVCPGGTYQLQDPMVINGILNLSMGTIDVNSFSLSMTLLNSNTTNPRGITLGTGTIFLTSAAAGGIFNLNANGAGLAFSGASGTIAVSSASVQARSMNVAGLTYGAISYVVNGSTGALTLSQGATIGTLNFTDTTNARTLTLTSGQTYNIGSWNVNGTAGKLMTVNSSTAGTAHTLSSPSGNIAADYLALQDSTATGGAAWYAGSHSTNTSNNTGWMFADAPVAPTVVGGSSNLLTLGV